MWKNISKMSKDEIASELQSLKTIKEITTKVNVEKILQQELDLISHHLFIYRMILHMLS